MPAVAQVSFAKGEISPSLMARIDLALFYVAARKVRNWIVRPYGGVMNRAGTMLCDEVKDSTKRVRLIEFIFSQSQSYVLEVGERYIRFHRDGGVLIIPEQEELAVTGIVPPVFMGRTVLRDLGLTIAGHPFQNGDTVEITGVATGIDGTRTVQRLDENTVGVWGLDYVHGDLTWSEAGTVSYPDLPGAGFPLEIETPYLEDDLAILKYIQSADVLTFCNPRLKTQQLSRYGNTDWRLEDFANQEGPFLDVNVDAAKTIIASGPTGDITLEANFDVFTQDHVDRMIYLEQSPDDNTDKWEVAKAVSVNSIRRRGVNYYQAAASGTTGTNPPTVVEGSEHDGSPGVKWNYLHSGFGIARITEITDARHATAEVIRRIPDQTTTSGVTKIVTNVVTGTPSVPDGEGGSSPVVYAKVRVNAHGFPDGNEVVITEVEGAVEANGTWTIQVIDANWFYLVDLVLTSAYTDGGIAAKATEAVPSYKWAFEAWGGGDGFPSATVFYQQRQIFGGSLGRPHTVWMSTTAGFTTFAKSIPLQDDDAITFDLSSERANEIRHFIRMKELVALTSECAWIIRKEQANPIPVADPQDEGGASHVRPLKIGKKAIYVEDKGSAIRSLGYEFSSDTYEGTDLTISASHLFFGKRVVEWAYQKVPFRCVWLVLDDGSLVGLTYLPEQEVVAWHRHDTDGSFESVCCIPEGKEDSVYVVVRREVGGVAKRFIERFASRFPTSTEDGFFVDCGLTYDGRGRGDGVDWTLTGGVDWSHEETLTFTTAENFFTGSSDVGDAIVLHETPSVEDLVENPGMIGRAIRLTIMDYVSPTEVAVLADRIVPEEFRDDERTGFDLARDTFLIPHLVGKRVSVLSDGNVESDGNKEEGIVVGEAGLVTLENPGVVVHIGLPYISDLETLDINLQGQSIQDKEKRVGSVTLLVEKTRGLSVGPDDDNLLELAPSMTGEYDQPVAEETDAVKANIVSNWSDGGRVLIRQSNPLPAAILAVIPEVQVGGA